MAVWKEETTTHVWPTVLFEKFHKEEVRKMSKKTNELSRRAAARGLCLKRGSYHKWAGELQSDQRPLEQAVTSSSRQSRTRSEFGSHSERACEYLSQSSHICSAHSIHIRHTRGHVAPPIPQGDCGRNPLSRPDGSPDRGDKGWGTGRGDPEPQAPDLGARS